MYAKELILPGVAHQPPQKSRVGSSNLILPRKTGASLPQYRSSPFDIHGAFNR